MFVEVKDRVAKKLAGLKGKLLSIGGREIFIKAVAQVVPTYTMSCFQLPKTLCHNLENMMRSFGGGKRIKRTKLHGSVGGKCVGLNSMEVWASETYKPSTLPY